ncbi:MAG: hypothetical protein LBU62_12000 [Bacteroidales bacterium]|jgi:hypothetical protein|nr:hypothetical protein [Bacteroidales bacterium]
MSRKFFLVCFSGWIATAVWAQTPKQFDNDLDQYLTAVEALFANIKTTEQDKALAAQFGTAWTSGVFSDNERQQILQFSNQLLAKKSRNIHYYALWRCMLAFKEPQNSAKGFDVWMNAMIKTAQDRKITPTHLQNLMNATELLLLRNVVFYSAGGEWRTLNNDIRYELVNNELSLVSGIIDLCCFAKGDSITISGTTGRYNCITQQWQGAGGTVTWERAGFAPSDVYATLRNYQIDMKQSQYTADSVIFFHKTYFPQMVQGKLIDKVRHNTGPEMAVFPEFHTYSTHYAFDHIFPDVSFEGGITIQGARTIGSGNDSVKAVVKIQKSDSLRLRVYSKSFIFRSDRMNAYSSSPVFYFGDDSIVHSNLSFSYLAPMREVSFNRSDAASSQAPYFNSYHKTDMNFEQLIWKLDEPEINFSFTRGSTLGRAQFRSQNYFNRDEYEKMQYFDQAHPLAQLGKCSQAFGLDEFPVEVYASFIKRMTADTRNQIINLAKQGYVVYDSDNDYIKIQPLLLSTLSAAGKKVDFDVISLRSLVNAPMKNAAMNIHTYDIDVNGVERIAVSDSQNVVITPKEQKVILTKNRGMKIAGRIDAGQMSFYGDSLQFDYDTFEIKLQRADSVIVFVPSPEKDAFGKNKMRRINNVIQHVSGNLQIDRPDNKSGRFSLNQYPILYSDSVSKVTYGSSSIESGAYNNDKFFFEIDPFVMDSLDHFEKEHFSLSGRFSSAEIFADMRRVIKVQPDYSLGFTFETGDSAITTYGNADLKANISLTNKGLRASGTLKFLTATIHSEDYAMYPDSMNIPKAKSFILEKQTQGVEFPEIKSEGNKIHWEPNNDRMKIYKTDKVFNLFDDKKFDGNLLLSSKGLSGKGRMDMNIADVRSDSVAFRSDSFVADESLFRLRVAKEGAYQFVTADTVQSSVNFTTRTGQFKAKSDYALVRFPETKLEARVSDFTWDMESTKINLGGGALSDAADFKYKTMGESQGTRYMSTMYGADSLNFVANSASYNYSSGLLKAEGVNLVQSGDALIFPNEGKLTVNVNGLLELNDNAKIVFNDTLRQHVIHSANVSISGRKKFSGSGIYDYTDETNKMTSIEITDVSTDKSGKTQAKGSISEESDFMLNPFYRFQGDILLKSDNKFPEFDGAAQIVQECETLHPDWVRFKSVVDPVKVEIEVGEAPVNKQFARIYNGLFLSRDSVYPAFLSQRNNYNDKQLIQASGVLHYNRDSMIYTIASKGKLANPDSAGNLLAFNRNTCIISGEGRISLGEDLGRVKLDAVGKIVHNLNTNETSFDVMLAVDFLFDAGLLSFVAAKIDSLPNLTGVDLRRTQYIKGLNEWLGTKQANRFRQESSLGKVKNIPDQLKHTLLLNQLRLVWDPARHSYRSVGKIGVGNMMGNQVNRLVDGFVEISKRPGGDMMDIYLKMSDNDWFYFGYTRELMQVLSSDQDFNKRLVKIPEKQRKVADKKPGYMYMISSAEKYYQFLTQMNRAGTNEPQPPSTGPEQPVPEASEPVVPKEPAQVIEIE